MSSQAGKQILGLGPLEMGALMALSLPNVICLRAAGTEIRQFSCVGVRVFAKFTFKQQTGPTATLIRL